MKVSYSYVVNYIIFLDCDIILAIFIYYVYFVKCKLLFTIPDQYGSLSM